MILTGSCICASSSGWPAPVVCLITCLTTCLTTAGCGPDEPSISEPGFAEPFFGFDAGIEPPGFVEGGSFGVGQAAEVQALPVVDGVRGLVASGHYPNPVPVADVVTTTTHKTLRGPRGGLILARENDELTKKFNSLVFPGTQGGPLMHVIAAKAVAFGEALQPSFRAYSEAVIANAQALAAGLVERGLAIVSGGTDTHLMLVDLRPMGLTGKDAEAWLNRTMASKLPGPGRARASACRAASLRPFRGAGRRRRRS